MLNIYFLTTNGYITLYVRFRTSRRVHVRATPKTTTIIAPMESTDGTSLNIRYAAAAATTASERTSVERSVGEMYFTA